MLELLFEFVCEIALQVVLEIAVEFGLHVFDPRERPLGPLGAAVGYVLLGGIAGGLSLAFAPDAFLQSPDWRATNLLVTPVIAGLAMMAVGAWRSRRGDARLRIDRFAYGYLFALAVGLVRFHFAH